MVNIKAEKALRRVGGCRFSLCTTTYDFTLTGSYETEELRLIIECRLDQSSAPQFNELTANQLTSFLIAAVYQLKYPQEPVLSITASPFRGWLFASE